MEGVTEMPVLPSLQDKEFAFQGYNVLRFQAFNKFFFLTRE